MEFEDIGRGPAILLIHGFPLDRSIWSAQAAVLSKSFRVIVPELPGFGASPPQDGPFPMERYAKELLELMDRAGVARFAAVGHSMGGYILFAMYRLAPDRLERIVLVCTRAGADAEEVRRARELNAARALAEGPGFLAESMAERALGEHPDPEVAERVRGLIRSASPSGTAAALRGMAARPDSTPLLAGIRIPALVVAGLEDKIVPESEARAMAAAIPGSTLGLVRGAGHLPMLERPDDLADRLFRFLGAQQNG
jgi:3-oxoadipate enol-lactonase